MIPSEIWSGQSRIVCGLMSGTSLDGVDAAIVRFSPSDNAVPHQELLAFLTLPLPEDILYLTTGIIAGQEHVETVSLVNAAFANLFADAVAQACEAAGIGVGQLDAIGSHGQTVWHQPVARDVDTYAVASTLQIGSPSALAQLTGVPVVGDFRTADVAAGGQGAPLVPLYDYHFLAQPRRDVIALNIGGMANITLLPAGVTPENIRAFDTGPGNVLIDLMTLKMFGKRYDTNGSIARDGIVLPRLLETLKKEPFITKQPPKSTGRELFTSEYLDAALKFNYMSTQPAEDPVRTVTEFTAWSIAENIRLFGNPASLIVASGGGIHNPVLMKTLARELPEAELTTSNEYGIPSDAKEAMCFAYLAWRSLSGLPGNLPSVTGASREATLGVIAWP
jgi:anhydro-N-acetylmuramic acid kinase